MNKKETGELRRRLTLDRQSFTALRGCYVSGRREIISCFDCSLNLMPEDEADKYLGILRKVFSGKPGTTSAELSFSTHQVTDSEEHKLLMALRQTKLRDDDLVKQYYEKVITALNLDGDYLILVAHDAYDVPTHGKDDSETVFSYIMSCVCPVKDTKPTLSYKPDDGGFHTGAPDRVAAMPELGFVFPTFDDRAANIYSALYYTRDAGENYPEFVESVFGNIAPKTALEQRETFQSVLCETAGEATSYDLIQNVREQLGEMIEAHDADKTETEPLTVSKRTMKALLEASGLEETKVAEFGVKFDEEFGENAEVLPQNILDLKKLELKTADVVIRVNPARGDLVQTRIIDGEKFILVRADDSLVLNGIDLNITEEPKGTAQ